MNTAVQKQMPPAFGDYYSIQNMPESERPRERLMEFGAEALSVSELIALILGSGTKDVPVLQLAQAILARFGSLQQLAQATVNELCQVKGVGIAKAIQLRAAFNLGLRLHRHVGSAKFKIEHPVHVYNLVKDDLQFEKREVVMVILQDAKGCVIGQHVIAIGTLTQALAHPREVFSPAIRHSAASIILVHNHPSGDLNPSKHDCLMTRQLIDAGNLLGIPLNDHLIISERGYLSLRQMGGIFQTK